MGTNQRLGLERSGSYPLASSPAVSAVMKGNKRVGTRPELRLRSALHAMGLRFRKDYSIRAGEVRARPDIVFTRRRLAVFVDGCFWHRCPDHGHVPGGQNAAYWQQKLEGNRLRDQRQSAALREDGWIVLRIWEHTATADAAEAVQGILFDQRSTDVS